MASASREMNAVADTAASSSPILPHVSLEPSELDKQYPLMSAPPDDHSGQVTCGIKLERNPKEDSGGGVGAAISDVAGTAEVFWDGSPGDTAFVARFGPPMLPGRNSTCMPASCFDRSLSTCHARTRILTSCTLVGPGPGDWVGRCAVNVYGHLFELTRKE